MKNFILKFIKICYNELLILYLSIPNFFFYIRWMKYLVNRLIFDKFYMLSAIVKPFRMNFTCTFQLTTFVGQMMIYVAHKL